MGSRQKRRFEVEPPCSRARETCRQGAVCVSVGPYLLEAGARGRLATADRELETQLSGPANPGVDFRTNHNYISMNNGDSASAHSDAMDKHVRGGPLTSRAGTDDHGTDDHGTEGPDRCKSKWYSSISGQRGPEKFAAG